MRVREYPLGTEVYLLFGAERNYDSDLPKLRTKFRKLVLNSGWILAFYKPTDRKWL